MKLLMATASPYVRKVLVVAHENGTIDRIEKHELAVVPTKANEELFRAAPLGRIPTLVLDDGTALYDSRVVGEYLDDLATGAKMFPASGAARWTALRRQALADGLLDSAVNTRYETFLRPEEHRWGDWIEAQKGKIARALDQMESEAGSLGDTVDIGTIGFACALGYLDFRFDDDGWRDSRPALAGWFETFSARPSMTATKPD